MKKILENWRRFVAEQEEIKKAPSIEMPSDDAGISPTDMPKSDDIQIGTTTEVPKPELKVSEPDVDLAEFEKHKKEFKDYFPALSANTGDIKRDELAKEINTRLNTTFNYSLKAAKKKYREDYSSPESEKTFIRWSREMDPKSWKGKPDEEIGAHYRKNVLPSVFDHDEIKGLMNIGADSSATATFGPIGGSDKPTGLVGGFYNREKNNIVINPYAILKTGDNMQRSVGEELSHAIDFNVKAGQLSPFFTKKADKKDLASLMGFSIMTSAEDKNLILPPEKAKVGGAYDYLTEPGEFYAKLKTIKNILPKEAFDKEGRIDRNKLPKIINNPRYDIFKIMDKTKVNEIGDLLDIIVKTEKPAQTTQIA